MVVDDFGTHAIENEGNEKACLCSIDRTPFDDQFDVYWPLLLSSMLNDKLKSILGNGFLRHFSARSVGKRFMAGNIVDQNVDVW